MIFNIVFGIWCFLLFIVLISVFGSDLEDHQKLEAKLMICVCMSSLTIMAKYPKIEENIETGWSNWLKPQMKGYKMACCSYKNGKSGLKRVII